MGDDAKFAAEILGKAVAELGANWVAALISQSIVPVIEDAIASLLAQATEALGKPAPELTFSEKLPSEVKGAEEPDMFNIEIQRMDYICRGGWSWFASYPMFAVRCGKSSPGGPFFVIAQRHWVRYGVLFEAVNKVRKDEAFPEDKRKAIKALPAAPFWGTVCCCVNKKDPIDPASEAMRKYWFDFTKDFGQSVPLAQHFRMGVDWEAQWKAWSIFYSAYYMTRWSYSLGFWDEPLYPYNETDCVILLLQNIAKAQIVPMLSAKIPNLPVCRSQMYYGMYSTVDTFIETAMVAWGPICDTITKVGVDVQKLVTEKAGELVEQIKPILQKILDIVQPMLKSDGGDEKKEAKSKEPELGDVIKNWNFAKTQTGGQFYSNITANGPVQAVTHLKDNVRQAIADLVLAKIQGAVGDKFNGLAIVTEVLTNMSKAIAKPIVVFTNLAHLLKQLLDQQVGDRTEKGMATICQDFKYTDDKSVLDVAGQIWQTFKYTTLNLWKDLYFLRDEVSSELSGFCQEARDPMLQVLDTLFCIQVRAMNAVRVTFCQLVKSSPDSRTAFRDAIFTYCDSVACEGWKVIAKALQEAILAQALNIFDSTLWPTIHEGLKLLAELVPEVLKSMGLKPVPLGRKVCVLLVTKGVNWASKKLLLALENCFFGSYA